MAYTQGNILDENGNKFAPNTVGDAVYDLAKGQKLTKTLEDTPDRTVMGYPKFNTATAYPSGQVVYHLNKLWKFTADHQGAWTGNDVEAYSTKDAISDVAAVISEALNAFNADFGGLAGRVAEMLDDAVRLRPLESSTAGAPSEANVPDNWREDLMGVWTGAPRFCGQEYIDKVSRKLYKCLRTPTNSTGDWTVMN